MCTSGREQSPKILKCRIERKDLGVRSGSEIPFGIKFNQCFLDPDHKVQIQYGH